MLIDNFFVLYNFYENYKKPVIITDENYNITFSNNFSEQLFGGQYGHNIRNTLNIYTEALQEDGGIISREDTSLLYFPVYNKENKKLFVFEINPNNDFVVTSLFENDEFAGFLATLSHELGTPLTVINGALSQMQRENNRQNPKIDTCIDLIYKNYNSILRLTQHFISLAKMCGSKEDRVQLKNVNFATFINDICLAAHEAATLKGSKVLFRSNSKKCNFAIDPFLLERIMYNLISNSIKFTAENEIITVNLDYDDDSIIISVCDNGIGMSRECIDNIFIGFQRNLSGPYIFGNGLGLKITKAYVEALEGTIDIKSAPGEGTCVTVQFPKRHVYEKSVLLCSFDRLEKQKLRMEFEECIVRNSPGNDNVTLYGF